MRTNWIAASILVFFFLLSKKEDIMNYVSAPDAGRGKTLNVGNNSAARDFSHNNVSTVINNIPDALLIRLTEIHISKISELSSENGAAKQVLINLSAQLAISNDAIITFFRLIRRQQVSLEQLKPKFIEIARSYNELSSLFYDYILENDTNKHSLSARQAIRAGNLDLAEVELRLAEQFEMAAANMRIEAKDSYTEAMRFTLSKVASYNAGQGMIFMLRSDYASASNLFQKAADLLLPFTALCSCNRDYYILLQARSLFQLGKERKNSRDLEKSVELNNEATRNLSINLRQIVRWSEIHVEIG